MSTVGKAVGRRAGRGHAATGAMATDVAAQGGVGTELADPLDSISRLRTNEEPTSFRLQADVASCC